MFKRIIILFISLLSANVFSGGLTETQKISHMQYYSGHVGLLVRQPAMANPDNCPREDLYIFPADHVYYKEITSLILAAHISGHEIKFYLNGCADGLPKIQHIYSDK